MSRSIFPIWPRRARCSAQTVQRLGGAERDGVGHRGPAAGPDRGKRRIARASAASGAAQGRAQAAVSWSAKPADPGGAAADRGGRGAARLALPDGVPRNLGRDLRWSLSASAKPDFSLVELGDFTARGAGIDIAGTGRIAERGARSTERCVVVVAELGAFSGLVGHRIGGRLSLDVTAEQQGGDRVLAKIDGSRRKPRYRGPRRERAGGTIGRDRRLRRARPRRRLSPRSPRR